MTQHELDFDNVRVFSNQMNFSSTGALVNFNDPIIHSMNKNASAMMASKSWPILKHRKNILLYVLLIILLFWGKIFNSLIYIYRPFKKNQLFNYFCIVISGLAIMFAMWTWQKV